MCHRDTDDIVGFDNGGMRQPVTFSTHNDSQTGFSFQLWIVEGNAVISKGHSSSTESYIVQSGSRTVKPRPGNEEYGAH